LKAILQLVGIGIGVFCIIQAFVTMDLGNDSKRWPECRGKIISIQAGRGGHATHLLTNGSLYYTYAPHGRAINSSCVTFGPLKLMVFDINLFGWAGPSKEIAEAENSYLKRGSVSVYYKPEDPWTCCLVPGYSLGWLIAYIVVGIGSTVGTIFFFYKSRKPPPPAPVKYLSTPPPRSGPPMKR